MRLRIRYANALFAWTLLGCEPGTSPDTPEPGPPPLPAIASLITQEGLQKVRLVEILVDSPTDDAQVFRVVYGDPVVPFDPCFPHVYDCTPRPREAIGLVYRSDAGWLQHPPPETVVGFFDVQPTHDHLATAEFFALVSAWSELTFQQNYKVLLAADPDTPIAGLRRIAAGLKSWIFPYVAERLLDNPTAVVDYEILESIATLPVFQGDAYREVRSRAQLLLANLP